MEHDRKRRPSTVQDYRRELKQRLIPEFAADTPLTEITTGRVEQFRERIVAEGVEVEPAHFATRLAGQIPSVM